MAHVNETDRVEELMSKWNGMDVVAYILVESGLQKFTGDRRKLHTLFRRLKDEASDVEADLLSEFAFATREVFAFSRELEQAIAYLQLGGLLVAKNPEYVEFEIRDDEDLIESLRQDAARIFTEEQQDALSELVRKFAEAVEE